MEKGIFFSDSLFGNSLFRVLAITIAFNDSLRKRLVQQLKRIKTTANTKPDVQRPASPHCHSMRARRRGFLLRWQQANK